MSDLAEQRKMYQEVIDKLEQENRKLKEERDFFKEQATLWRNDYKNEYEKNIKLKAELEEADKAKMNALNGMSDLSSFGLEQVNKLEERIRFLEQCLDNKEKVNKSLREEIRNLKLTIEQMENTCKDYLNDRDTLREENRNLKERIKELEKEIEELNKMMLFETKI